MTLLLFISLSHAHLEHKPGQGMIVDEKRLSKARGCFTDIKLLGCGHPREDIDFFKSCLDEKSDQLTSDCQNFFQRLYGKKK